MLNLGITHCLELVLPVIDLKGSVSDNSNVVIVKYIHLCFCGSLFAAGSSACFVTALPLDLDQMPDASSSSIISHTSSFVFIVFLEVIFWKF